MPAESGGHAIMLQELSKLLAHLFSHDPILVIFGQSPDELQKLLPLLDARRRPRRLETLEQVVQLLRREVPGQLGQQVVHVLDDGLVLANLRGPDVVQVLEAERLLFDDETNDFL